MVPGRPRATAAMVPRRLREVFQVVETGTQEEAIRVQARLLCHLHGNIQNII